MRYRLPAFFWLMFGVAVTSAQAQSSPQISIETTAPYAILVDVGTNTVLFEKKADEQMAPASMAKLMTQEYVFNQITTGQLKLEDEFQVSENAWRKGGAMAGGSTMFAELNSKISIENLLKGSMIVSANDACIVLAEGLGGSEEEFALALTRRAQELGMTRSRFMNSTGLPDPDLKTTARDLSKLAIHIIKSYPDYYKWYSEKEFTWTIKTPQQNRNPLLRDFGGADGMKTGYTKESGYGLVGSAVREDRRLLLVINGLQSINERATEAKKLLEWGFRNFDSRKLVVAGGSVGEAKVFGGTKGGVSVGPVEDVSVLAPRTSQPRDIKAKVVYNGPIKAPVVKGQEIGKLQVYNGTLLVLERPLVAQEDVEEGTLTQRAIDGAYELIVGLYKK